jgi:hypothetical protein
MSNNSWMLLKALGLCVKIGVFSIISDEFTRLGEEGVAAASGGELLEGVSCGALLGVFIRT